MANPENRIGEPDNTTLVLHIESLHTPTEVDALEQELWDGLRVVAGVALTDFQAGYIAAQLAQRGFINNNGSSRQNKATNI